MKKKWAALVLAVVLLAALFPANALASGEKLVALTFDDGPSRYTSALLDGLESRGAVATFFMNGRNGGGGIVNYRGLLDRMREDGDQLANHTYSHANFSSLSAGRVSSEVQSVETLLYSAMGASYRDCVRTPGGALSATIRANVGAPIILWSVDPRDWKDRNADTVYNRVVSNAKDGSIILLHDLYKTSVEAGLRAVDTLQARGYTFVTVAELMRRRGVTLENGVDYRSAPNTGVNLPAYSAPTAETWADPEENAVDVAFSSANGSMALYYTTDGTTPTLACPQVTGTIRVYGNTDFRVAGIDAWGTRTPVLALHVPGAVTETPTASFADGRMTLRCAAEDASIYYTTDGSRPTTDSALYTGPFTPGTTTRCLAVRAGCHPSRIATYTFTEYGALFADVSASAWFYSYVGRIVRDGVMTGTGEAAFSPDGEMTRGMLVTVLYNRSAKPAVPAGTVRKFDDVADGVWYTDAVKWAAASGIVNGVEDNLFEPGAPLTRQQLAAILYRYSALTGQPAAADASVLSAFRDAGDVSSYARTAMAWCVAKGLLSGMGDGTLSPRGTATRAQCAAILVRLAGEAA